MIQVLLLAAIAFLIYKKLFSTFGDRPDSSKRINDITPEERIEIAEFQKSLHAMMHAKRQEAKQIDVISGLEAELRTEDREVFDNIRKEEPAFSADRFLKGAKIAHEMLMEAFSKDDREVLKEYTMPSFFKSYVKKINSPENQNRIPAITVTKVVAFKIFSSSIENYGSNATINTRIVTEQIKLIKDRSTGEIVAGDSNKIFLSDEIWTFKKHLAKSKIWKLDAISLTDSDKFKLREEDERY